MRWAVGWSVWWRKLNYENPISTGKLNLTSFGVEKRKEKSYNCMDLLLLSPSSTLLTTKKETNFRISWFLWKNNEFSCEELNGIKSLRVICQWHTSALKKNMVKDMTDSSKRKTILYSSSCFMCRLFFYRKVSFDVWGKLF